MDLSGQLHALLSQLIFQISGASLLKTELVQCSGRGKPVPWHPIALLIRKCIISHRIMSARAWAPLIPRLEQDRLLFIEGWSDKTLLTQRKLTLG